MRQLLLATRNAHKTQEFAQMLGAEFEVRDLADASEFAPVEETGLTFAENAILKAVAASKQFPELVVADDSGLEVDGLGGAPGIYSARYAGEGASDAENVAKLLAQLARFKHCEPRCLPDRSQGFFGGGGGAAGPGGGTAPAVPVTPAALIW